VETPPHFGPAAGAQNPAPGVDQSVPASGVWSPCCETLAPLVADLHLHEHPPVFVATRVKVGVPCCAILGPPRLETAF
jgi:hypothetical protein